MRAVHHAVVVLALIGLPSASPAGAATLVLGTREQDEAMTVGRRSIYDGDFGAEWQVKNAAGDPLVVMTPFHRLALAARHATFKGEPLEPRNVEALLKSANGKLEFWATLRGPGPDFARFYAPVLLVPGRPDLAPSFVQNERTALPEGNRYAARCLYVFPSAGINPTAPVILLVRDAKGAEVAKFTVNLGGMR
jgi:hypothetical protein